MKMTHCHKEKGAMSPWVVLVLVVMASIVVCAAAWLRAESLRGELKSCRQDMSIQLEEGRQKAVASIEEKYSADRISYEVMSRRIAEMSARERTSGTDKK